MVKWTVKYLTKFSITLKYHNSGLELDEEALDRLEEFVIKAKTLAGTEIANLPCAQYDDQLIFSNLRVLRNPPWTGFYYLDHCRSKAWGLLTVHQDEQSQQKLRQLYDALLKELT